MSKPERAPVCSRRLFPMHIDKLSDLFNSDLKREGAAHGSAPSRIGVIPAQTQSGINMNGRRLRDAIHQWMKQVNEKKMTDQLIKQVNERKITEARSMIAAGIDPNTRDSRGYSALMTAIDDRETELVQLLLNAGT